MPLTFFEDTKARGPQSPEGTPSPEFEIPWPAEAATIRTVSFSRGLRRQQQYLLVSLKTPRPGAPQSPEGNPSPEFKTTVATKGTLAVRVASSPWSANILASLTRLSPSKPGVVSVEKGGERPTTS